MKRNLYAAVLLVLVCAVVIASSRFVTSATDQTRQQVQMAYQAALNGDFDIARNAYRSAADQCRQNSRLLYLMVRRSLLDEINESLALLSNYAQADNMADLGVETSRVTEQLDQLQDSFLAAF